METITFEATSFAWCILIAMSAAAVGLFISLFIDSQDRPTCSRCGGEIDPPGPGRIRRALKLGKIWPED